MTFEHPEQLLWALLIVPLAAIFLWPGLRRPRVTATLSLWQKALARRTPWERWRDVAAAAMLSLIVLLLAIALAEPVWLSQVQAGRNWAMIIDNSASMNVVDGTVRRRDAALAAARNCISRMGPYDAALVLSSSAFTVPQRGLVRDPRSLNQTLEQIPATDQPGDLAKAVQIARQALHGQPNVQILVFTDSQGAADLARAAANSPQEPIPLVYSQGGSVNNLAITRMAGRALPAHPEQVEVLVEVANFSATAQQTQLSFKLGESLLEKSAIELAAGAKSTHTILLPANASGLCRAEIEGADALAADNVAGLLTAPAPRRRLALTADAPDFLRRAASAAPRAEVSEDALSDEGVADVRLFSGQSPAVLPPGPTIVVAPRGDSNWWKSQDSARGSLVAAWTFPGDPLARGVDWNDWVIEEVSRLSFLDSTGQPLPAVAADLRTAQRKNLQLATLAAAGETPIVSLLQRQEGAVLVLHVDPENSDLELQRGFPLWIANAVDFLAPSQGSAPHAWKSTDTLLLPPGEARQMNSPTGQTHSLPAGPCAVGLDEIGLWRIEEQGGSERAVFANLLSPTESDLRPAAATSAELPADRSSGRPLWQGLVAIALLLAGLEWIFFQRGWL